MMVLASVVLESLVSEPDALTTRPPPCDLPGLINADEEYVARFHSYEYTPSEIIITCGI